MFKKLTTPSWQLISEKIITTDPRTLTKWWKIAKSGHTASELTLNKPSLLQVEATPCLSNTKGSVPGLMAKADDY